MSANSSFNDIVRLTDREIQTLMREVDQKDLVVALKAASDELKDKVLGNFSKRVRTFITEEMEFLGPMPLSEVEEVQLRIVQQVEQLAEQGHVTWPPVEKPASQSKAKKKKPSKKYLETQRRLKQQVKRPLSELSYDEINSVFVGLGERARREGILALESLAQSMTDPFMKDGVQLAVDGTEPDLIIDILETWMESLLHEQKRKYQKVMEGIMAIQSGDNPRIIGRKLEVIY